MDELLYLIPVALGLGVVGLIAFLWAMRSGQFDDLDGAANRILFDDATSTKEMTDDEVAGMLAADSVSRRSQRATSSSADTSSPDLWTETPDSPDDDRRTSSPSFSESASSSDSSSSSSSDSGGDSGSSTD